jgi:hypothetical protein
MEQNKEVWLSDGIAVYKCPVDPETKRATYLNVGPNYQVIKSAEYRYADGTLICPIEPRSALPWQIGPGDTYTIELK